MVELQINWRGNCFGKGSYSIVSRELVLALWERGYDVVLEDLLGRASVRNPLFDDHKMETLREVLKAKHKTTSEQIHIRSLSRPNEHECGYLRENHRAAQQLVPETTNIACFAIDGLEVDPFCQYRADDGWELLIVPSRHSAQALQNWGVSNARIAVVPHGVDHGALTPAAQAIKLPTERACIFLMNSAPWLDRKNFEGAFKAYLDEFTSADNVSLIVHSPIKSSKRPDTARNLVGAEFQGQIAKLGEELRSKRKDAPEIVYVFEDFSETKLAGLYTASNCLLHPHRAEAFGLAILEAMACGLPAITTAWGGNLDYCTAQNSLLVPYSLIKSARSSPLTWAEPTREIITWAEPSQVHIRAWLRWVYEHPSDARNIGNVAAASAKLWGWTTAAETLVAEICRTLKAQVAFRY